jgi:hypothetical protein
MYSIVLSFQTAAIYSLTAFARTNKAIWQAPIILICVLMLFYAIEPSRFNIWFEKISPVIEEGIEPENIGTYVFRQRLLEDSIKSLDENKKSLWGMGYQREYDNILGGKTYSYAMGEDAPIASIIYCEGWGGLFLRILPYLFLLWLNIKRFFFVEEKDLRLFSAAVIGVIVAQMPSYLQTASITHYEYIFVPLAIVELIIIKFNYNYQAKGAT